MTETFCTKWLQVTRMSTWSLQCLSAALVKWGVLINWGDPSIGASVMKLQMKSLDL